MMVIPSIGLILLFVVVVPSLAGWLTRDGWRISLGVLGFWQALINVGIATSAHESWGWYAPAFGLLAGGVGAIAAFSAAHVARWLDRRRAKGEAEQSREADE